MTIQTVEAVLFDIDDTLFDRRWAQREILRRIAARFPSIFDGLAWPRVLAAFLESDRITTAEINSRSTAGDDVRLRRSARFLRLLGLGEGEDRRHAKRLTAFYVDHYPDLRAPVAEAADVVRGLAERFPLGIVSNGLPDAQYRKLEALGLRRAFHCVILSGEIGIWKPDPRIFWRASAALAVPPAACVYVGDKPRVDVVGARRAGMRSCWFNPCGKSSESADVAPDWEIARLAELDVILR